MSEQDRLDSQVETALQQQKAATIDALQASRSKAAVLRLAEQVHRGMSAAIDSLPSKAQHACAPGCFFCCYLPVDVLPPEALRIAAHLKQTRSPGELADLVCRLGAYGQQDFGARPCVFLADQPIPATCTALRWQRGLTIRFILASPSENIHNGG